MKFNPGMFNEYVEFVETKVDNSGSFVKKSDVVVFGAYCKIDGVRIRDYQTAISTNTINDFKLFMRYDGRVHNKLKIKHSSGDVYEIKQVLGVGSRKEYMNVVVERIDANED